MGSTPHNFEKSNPIARVAGEWLARRDRGLTAAEQDAYLQWLRQDHRHSQMIAHLEKTWQAFDALAKWRPAHSAQPNPDLLALPRRDARSRWRTMGLALIAVAAAGALIFFSKPQPPVSPQADRGVHVIPRPESLTLSDGSVVELNHGGKIETDFTPGERRVRLVRGEAHFTVAKNPLRPFVVEAGAVAVRAVGTAFEVRRANTAVEVLVTEGKVHVEQPPAAGKEVPVATPLVAGERAIVDTTKRAEQPVVTAVTAAEIERALAWKGVRLEFASLPLGEVVSEFNLRNATQMVVGDPETAELRVGGTFRADNVEAFVRLLQISFGVTVERGTDGTVVLHHPG